MKMRKLLVVTVLIFALFVVSIPQTFAQTIYICVKKSGTVRYVTGPGMCKKTETQISWGQGSQGPAGHSPVLTWSGDQIAIDGVVTGPHLTGPGGATGATGATGAQGVSGVSFDLSKSYTVTTRNKEWAWCNNDDVSLACSSGCLSGAIDGLWNYSYGYDDSTDQIGEYGYHWAGICYAHCSSGDPWGVQVLCMPRN